MPVALVALLAAACSVESPSRPDSGPDPGEDGGGPGPDAPIGGHAGLVLEFRGVPALEADLGGTWDARLEEVRLDLENVRAVGDAAPGDSRTSVDSLRLEWWGGDDGEDPQNEPVVVTFDQAPPGLYSNVVAELSAYRMQGTVDLAEDNERDFDIDDQPAPVLAISIPLGGLTLEVGETRRLIIEVACADAVLDTPWDQVEPDDGDLVVDRDAPEIVAIRDVMESAFTFQGDGGEVDSGEP